MCIVPGVGATGGREEPARLGGGGKRILNARLAFRVVLLASPAAMWADIATACIASKSS